MTGATTDLTGPSADITSVRDALERAGWRFTRQRAAVLGYLRSVNTHPTAEEVYGAVRSIIPNISLATVYKALEALVDCRLAAKLDYAEGPARYDHRTDAHYHVRCISTGQVRDLSVPFDPNLIDKLNTEVVENLRQQGFQVTGYRLELLGTFQNTKS
jgi:Fur family peroxide stress response transcriptional regulator